MTTTYSAAVRAAPEEHHTVPLAPGSRPPSQPHRRLYTVAAILGGCGILALVIYVTSATEMHHVANTLLACFITALIALAGAALMLGYSVRTRADEAQALHAQQVTASAACAEQQQVMVGMLGQVSTRLQRLEGAERRQDELTPAPVRLADDDLLRGLAAWAAQIDRKLTEVQRATTSTQETVPAQSNGHREDSPMELSDEALRGYFLGFYDRSKGEGNGSAGDHS